MLQVKQLSLCYPNAEPLWQDISFHLKQGDALWLKGANGSGKTSLLYTLANVIPQTIEATRQGEIYLQGSLSNDIPLNCLSPQVSLSLSNPKWEMFFTTLEEELCFALENIGLTPVEIETRLQAALTRFHLIDWLECPVHKLSPGWQKMVSLAAQAALKPGVLLLDEPLAGLSETNAQLVIDWMQDYLKEGGVIVAAEHSHLINEMHPQILVLAGNKQ